MDSDFIKLIVEIGTEIVKLIDKMGSLNLVIAGLFAYLNRNGDLVDFSKLFSGFKNVGVSIDKAKEKLAELEEQRKSLGSPTSEKNRRKVDALDQEINKYKEMLKPNEDLVEAQKKLEAAQNRLANTKSTNPETIKKYQREVDKAKENVDNLTAAQQRTGTTGQSAFKKLGKGIKAFGKQVASVIAQMLVMWAITKTIELLVKGFDKLITTAEEASEAYEELNNELDALKDNLRDINDELSTLDDKIAELTAKNSLTFSEQEELDRLRAQREELERTLELNKQLVKQKQQQVNAQTIDQVEYYRNKGTKSGQTASEITSSGTSIGAGVGAAAGVAGLAIAGGAATSAGVAAGGAALATKIGAAIGTTIAPGVGTAIGIALGALVGVAAGSAIGGAIGAGQETVGESIDNIDEKLAKKEKEVIKARAKYQKSGKDSDKKKYEEAQQALSNYRGEMAQYFTEIDAMYQNTDLSTIEDPDEYKRLKEEMNDFYNERDRWLIKSGAEGAKSNAIERIFDKEDYTNASNTIDDLVKKLEKDPTDQSVIDKISEQCKVAEKDLDAVSLSVDDAIDYFTMLGQNAAFNIVEGKIKEISSATSKLQTLLSDTKSSDFTGLFGHGGEVSSTAIAEYFQGTSEATREEIARLVKGINDGKISVDHALRQFELFGIQSVVEIEITEVQTNFKDAFPDLEDADGLIDSFQELADAIVSTSKALDSLNAAQAEMKASGRVSIETALKLMESTDDYSKVLTISNGKLVLAEDAEENLIEARISSMKASALAALEETQNAKAKAITSRETAITALETYNSSIETEMAAAVTATAWDKLLAAAAGLWAGIKSLLTDESWTEAYERAYQETLNSLGGDRVAKVEAKYNSAEESAKKSELENAIKDADKTIKELEEEEKKRQGNYSLVSGLTKDNIGDVVKSDGFDNPEEVANDAFQREMDYWENRISANQAKYEQIQNEIDLLEAKGQKADASFYEEQIKLENQRRSLLEQQKASAKAYIATLEEGSEAWWDVANTLNDIEGELDDITASIVDLQDAIGEIDTYKFEEFNTRTSNLAGQLGTIRDLLADEDEWFNDSGEWTEDGVAALGTYIQELEIYKNALSETEDELAKYQAQYAGNESYYEGLGIHSEQEYYDKVTEIQNQYSEYLTMIDDTEDAVVDMYESQIDAVEDYVDTLIDGYNDYIDSVKEALDAERDLYDFKKNVQKQAKDIADLERRIASLSGSTNAADIAERRKLEAQLYESRESLNDTYYEHAQESQQNALDEEASAYEESMNNMVEGIRTSLEEATSNMDEFLMGVTSMVMYNADTILAKYEETNPPLTTELTNPWTEAKNATDDYSGNALDLMNQWIEQGGFFEQFNTSGTTSLSSLWSAGTMAANTFSDSVTTVMGDVVSTIDTNVATASSRLSELYNQIQDATNQEFDLAIDIDPYAGTGTDAGTETKEYHSTATLDIGTAVLTSKGTGTSKSAAESKALTAMADKYYNYKKSHGGGNDDAIYGLWSKTKSKVKYDTQYYAKGTTGTRRDAWAITDELGPELILHADPTTGRLQYLTKGSGVIPHDATTELMKLADIGVDGLMVPKFDSGVNMMTNYITKPEFNFSIENFLKVERVDQDTLPKLEAMMDKKIDIFAKQLNYSIKKFSR